MKTLLKLVIVALVLHAAVRGAMAMWTYYQLKDAAQQTLVFGAQAQPGDLHGRILQKASELAVPIKAEDLVVERHGSRTTASAKWVDGVQILPGRPYPIDFSFAVEAYAVTGAVQ